MKSIWCYEIEASDAQRRSAGVQSNQMRKSVRTTDRADYRGGETGQQGYCKPRTAVPNW
jgi:hypothetical protein